MNLPTLPWGRLLAEGTLIIVSVYLAIVLEGMSQDRDAEQAEQRERDGQYEALIQWLANPESMPRDSFGSAMDSLFGSDSTLYPRSSAWTNMVASGQLAELGHADLGRG